MNREYGMRVFRSDGMMCDDRSIYDQHVQWMKGENVRYICFDIPHTADRFRYRIYSPHTTGCTGRTYVYRGDRDLCLADV